MSLTGRGHGEELEPSDEDRRFQRQLDELTVEARSVRGWLTVRSRALVWWQVSIAGEPAGSLSEREFLAELDSVIGALLADYDAQVIVLTDAVYDIGLPREMRAGRQGVA
ncbi:hypothetical protein ACIBSW_12585 [Actinoplanes sp. NPDC049668]|uniref:hypothetical protein n=1 Tax=unclassified Actinoplanes TaxID=2626549 RepID=UPI0033B29683